MTPKKIAELTTTRTQEAIEKAEPKTLRIKNRTREAVNNRTQQNVGKNKYSGVRDTRLPRHRPVLPLVYQIRYHTGFGYTKKKSGLFNPFNPFSRVESARPVTLEKKSDPTPLDP